MVGMAQRFPRFSDRRFPVFRFPYTVCLTTYEKDFSLRSKWRCGGAASWGFASLWLALPVGSLMTGFPFFVLRIYTVLPRMKKISRFARNDDGRAASWSRSAIEMSLYIYYSYRHGEAASHFCSLAWRQDPQGRCPAGRFYVNYICISYIPIRLFHGNCAK